MLENLQEYRVQDNKEITTEKFVTCVYVTDEDILQKLKSERRKFNQCVFTKAEINNEGTELNIYCRLI